VHRRAFLATVAGGLLAASLASEAQPTRLPRIGILTTASPGASPPANFEAFVQGLRESGYVEGRNILFEQRHPEERPELFPALAADLVRLNVDLIFARGPWAVAAAKSATRAIPIIGIDLESDPVADGLVKSLARPGENLTGMFLDLAELSGKQVQILKEIIPKLSRVAVLGDPAVNSSQIRELRAVGRSLAVQIQVLEMKTAKDLAGAFATENKRPSEALIVLSNPLTLASRGQIADVATTETTRDVSLPSTCGAGRPHLVRARSPGNVPALRCLRCSGPGWRQTGRATARATGEVRDGDQSQDREGPRPDNPSVASVAGG